MSDLVIDWLRKHIYGHPAQKTVIADAVIKQGKHN